MQTICIVQTFSSHTQAHMVYCIHAIKQDDWHVSIRKCEYKETKLLKPHSILNLFFCCCFIFRKHFEQTNSKPIFIWYEMGFLFFFCLSQRFAFVLAVLMQSIISISNYIFCSFCDPFFSLGILTINIDTPIPIHFGVYVCALQSTVKGFIETIWSVVTN